MEPPAEPKQEDCCNSGCNPCIFDIYEKRLKLFNNGKESSLDQMENGIFELKYTTFVIVRTKLLGPCLKMLNFRRYNENTYKVWWKPGDHFLYKYVSDNLSCTRAYTPVKLNSSKDDGYDFSIVVKCYANGLVSNHLFNLKEGEQTLWRGPYGLYKIETNKYNRVIMIAQGTGIAPFITIVDNILNNEDDITKIFLFYCCQSIDEILFRDQLYLYRSYWNFSYVIFLTNIASDIHIRYQEPIITRRFICEDLNQLKPYSNDQFLICGSSEFMKYYENSVRDKYGIGNNIILF